MGKIKRSADRLHYAIRPGQHVIVPESEYLITSCFKFSSSFAIVFRLLLMLTAIYFNYETHFQTDKVGYVRAYWVLPSELELLQVPTP